MTHLSRLNEYLFICYNSDEEMKLRYVLVRFCSWIWILVLKME